MIWHKYQGQKGSEYCTENFRSIRIRESNIPRGKVNVRIERRRVGARGCAVDGRRVVWVCRRGLCRCWRGIYRISYRNRCLLQRGPGDAATFSAACSAESAPSRFLSYPPVVLGSILFGKRFSPFLPRDRTLTPQPA